MDQHKGLANRQDTPPGGGGAAVIQTPINTGRRAEREDQNHSPTGQRPPWSIWLEIIVCGSTLAMAGVSIWQGYLTKRSNEFTRTSVEATQRARLFITEVSRGEVSANMGNIIYVTLKNSGNVTAESVIVADSSVFAPSNRPFPDNPSYEGIDEGKVSMIRIGPSDSVVIPVELAVFDDTESEAIFHNTGKLYAYMIINYDDGFHNARYVKWCAWWSPTDSSWSGCDKYNSGD